MPLKKRIEKLIALQVSRLSLIHDKCGLNLITCGLCGEPQFVRRDSSEANPEQCYNCGDPISNETDPDLIYEGMCIDDITWKTVTCNDCSSEEHPNSAQDTWSRCNVCGVRLCPKCVALHSENGGDMLCTSCRGQAIAEFIGRKNRC